MQAPKYIIVAVLLTLGLILGSAGAQASLTADFITNGGFEEGANEPTTWFRTLETNATDIEGWTVTAGSVDWTGTYWTAQAGFMSLDLSGNGQGAVSTTFATSPGVTYLVTFYMSGNFEGGEATKKLEVSAGDEFEIFSFAEPANWSGTNMGWTRQTWTFTADDDFTQLTFTSLENNAHGPALDSVTVEVVPLPPAALLLASGLLGLLGWRREKHT